MPGIVGLITNMPRERAERELVRMVESLCHETFYVKGTWVDERMGVYVGWVARKGSFCDGMPLANETGDKVLVFSGEDFPEPGIRRELKARGHSFDPTGPSYLAHAAEESGFLSRLNGRFHGLLIDRALNTATLFNDRYGMHRIYYHEARDAFYFAAEAKAILGVRPELREISLKSLGEFVTCGCVMENRSLFENVGVLPCASAWQFKNGTLAAREIYFQPREWEEQPLLDAESYYQELRRVFTATLPKYFQAGEALGMSLTGGLDSRMILAGHRVAAGSLPCYTFGGSFRDSQDVRVSRQLARHYQQPFTVIPVGDEFLSSFARYAERTVFLTDGCVSVSHCPDLYANERARQIAPARMTGNYGSEVLRGNRAFKPMPKADLFLMDLDPHFRTAENTYGHQARANPVTFAAFRQAPWHHYGLQALEQTQVSLRSPFLDNELVRIAFRAPAAALADKKVSERLVLECDPAAWRIWTDRGPINGSSGTLMGSAARGVIDFLRRAEYAYDYGMPHWLARVDRILSPLHLEKLFLGHQKFYHFRVWYRTALSNYVKEMLLDPRALARPYLRRDRVEAVVQGHWSGTRNHTLEIHTLLTLELLHRLFVD